MLEMDPSRRGKVLLETEGGQVQEFEGVMLRGTQDGNHFRTDLLVAGGCIFHISLTSGEEGFIVDADITTTAQNLTNSIALQVEQFHANFAAAESATLELNGQALGRMGTQQIDGQTTQHRHLAEVLSDIVAIEGLLRTELPVLDGEVTAYQRVELRRQRLILEGKVVADTWESITTTTDTERRPKSTLVAPKVIKVGNIELQVAAVIVANAEATADFIGRTDDGNRYKYKLSTPPGQRFLTWDPERAKVRQDYLGIGVTLWGLEGITEGSLPI